MSEPFDDTLPQNGEKMQKQNRLCLIIESDQTQRITLSDCAIKQGFEVVFCDDVFSCPSLMQQPDTVIFGHGAKLLSSEIIFSEIGKLIQAASLPVLSPKEKQDILLHCFDDVHGYFDMEGASSMLHLLISHQGAKHFVRNGTLLKVDGIHQFSFKTIEEAQVLALSIAGLAPFKSIFRLALNELLVNAVEHGNLNIKTDEKVTLRAQGKLMEEVNRRLLIAPYCTRQVRLYIEKSADKVHLKIEDEGMGFDWQSKLEKVNQVPLNAISGRGLKIVLQAGFDYLRYVGSGNVVECSFSLKEKKVARLG
jgi:anti-sigma regulatory factor (Ser/Thr protein kinase)